MSTSGKEWYNDWQRMETSNKNDNEWQRVIKRLIKNESK